MSDLVVENLVVTYGKATAVDRVSLKAKAGEVTALVGPNGAGKSSTVLGIYGSVPTSGRVRIGDTDLAGSKPMARARGGLAIVPQGRQLFPRMTVLENIRVMAELLRLDRGRVDEALARYPILEQRRNAYAGVLSGGEQQMLVVTRALMARPSVILLDEMMTGLAPKIVSSLADTVAELAHEGTAVLMAGPSLLATRGMVDRGYVIVRGRIVDEADSADELGKRLEKAMGIIHARIDAEASATESAANVPAGEGLVDGS